MSGDEVRCGHCNRPLRTGAKQGSRCWRCREFDALLPFDEDKSQSSKWSRRVLRARDGRVSVVTEHCNRWPGALRKWSVESIHDEVWQGSIPVEAYLALARLLRDAPAKKEAS